ncbi:cysteine-rich receptor-like protein kinase 6 isoform X3 [Panicum virgatum]|uniref:Cysteine-rich receptor-like protein kinase 25 n=1 Tax=Panicum virgatum TaxID=38727 RepID=A0A8T0XJB9_PANVG|nr:cysteine-rich receptor-like protein kinase 6 isoform X3 [Panicum virgatum]KAG2657424.1 hypothetical protein PVAP13_1KG175800 [Panicum virgatum]
MLAGAGYGILAVVLVLMLPQVTCFSNQTVCDNGSEVAPYAANGTFRRNLGLLAASLPGSTSAAPAGFANATEGASPDQVYATALCRGDLNASSCRACVAAAFADAVQGCPGNRGVAVYEDACSLRFSGQRFTDFLREDQWKVSEILWEPEQDTATVEVPAEWFSAAVTKILAAVIDRAAAGNSTATKKYFATGEEDFDPRIYGLAQCSPMTTPPQCRGCLGLLLGIVAAQYLGARPQWVRVVSDWCSLMYSARPFYEGRAMLQVLAPPASAAPKAGAGKKRSEPGILAGVACSVVVVLILSVFVFVRRRRRANKPAEKDHLSKKITRAQCMIFDLPALQEATENFSENNKLGEGGFGTVYRGILSDGQEIAVKKLLGRTGHGLHQLHNEVRVLAELQHKNLVRLQGFCSHPEETLLVCEYIKNGSLDNFLFDFGLARLLGEDHSQTKTTKVVGTFGYMAPEYVIDGSVSTKIDIFSFGVLVLEIVTRRNNSSSEDHDAVNLLSDVWNCWTKGTVSQMVDQHQSLDGYFLRQALRCIHIGLLCVQPDPDDRPRISSVVFMLTRGNMELPPPAQPAFYFGRESNLPSPSCGQRSYAYGRPNIGGISVNEVTLTEPYPR